MMTRGTPISGNSHMISYDPNNINCSDRVWTKPDQRFKRDVKHKTKGCDHWIWEIWLKTWIYRLNNGGFTWTKRGVSGCFSKWRYDENSGGLTNGKQTEAELSNTPGALTTTTLGIIETAVKFEPVGLVKKTRPVLQKAGWLSIN